MTKLCKTGKVQHKSMTAADAKLQRMMGNPKIKNKELLGIYKCGYCKDYHIGNSEKNKHYTGK